MLDHDKDLDTCDIPDYALARVLVFVYREEREGGGDMETITNLTYS